MEDKTINKISLNHKKYENIAAVVKLLEDQR